ncbi:MAG: 6,7-dimethyl-8-ribityllumazine synthase [Candidatus Margulisiibacteriota bacterium]
MGQDLQNHDLETWIANQPIKSRVGETAGNGYRFAIVCARFNARYTTYLFEGAVQTLRENGVSVEDMEAFWVPGAFELPVTALHAARTGRFAAVICLGVIIKGDTAHFDYVAGPCADGIMQAALQTGVPVIFGVLTAHDTAQVDARVGGSHGHTGENAARAALQMANILPI